MRLWHREDSRAAAAGRLSSSKTCGALVRTRSTGTPLTPLPFYGQQAPTSPSFQHMVRRTRFQFPASTLSHGRQVWPFSIAFPSSSGLALRDKGGYFSGSRWGHTVFWEATHPCARG